MQTLYNIIATLVWPLLYFYPPFRGTIGKRTGSFSFQRYNAESSGLKVLINAVSAGEVVAIAPLIHELRRQIDGVQVVLMTTTDSGQEMARGKLGEAIDALIYFPLIDLPFVVRRYLSKLKPDLYITTEAEVWPNIQSQCRKAGIPVVLANARLYMHNKTGLRAVAMRRLYEQCDLIICQDEGHRENFRTFGIAEQKLVVSGNTKFDFQLEEWTQSEVADEKRRLGLGAGQVLVAGSTHPGEEAALLSIYEHLKDTVKGLKLVLAPRHVERTEEVLKLAASSRLTAASLKAAEETTESNCDVIVVDRYGVLTDMYQLADVVIMGGTFSEKVGGHNILEATALGKPVIVGPHVYSIKAQMELFGGQSAVLQAEGYDEAQSAIYELLSGVRDGAAIGERAKNITLANRGAAKRAIAAILDLKNSADV